MHYFQVYASGGGVNSIVLTLWINEKDTDAGKPMLETILQSVELTE
jgi:hypothetical protein